MPVAPRGGAGRARREIKRRNAETKLRINHIAHWASQYFYVLTRLPCGGARRAPASRQRATPLRIGRGPPRRTCLYIRLQFAPASPFAPAGGGPVAGAAPAWRRTEKRPIGYHVGYGNISNAECSSVGRFRRLYVVYTVITVELREIVCVSLPLQLSAYKIHPADCDTSLPETRRDKRHAAHIAASDNTLQSMLQSARQRAQRITITHTLTRHRRHGMMCAALWSRTHTPSHTPTCRRLVVSSSCCSRRSPAQLRGAACSYWKSCPQRHAALSAKTRNTPMTQTQIPHLLTRTHARMHASTQARAHARARTQTHTHTSTKKKKGKKKKERKKRKKK